MPEERTHEELLKAITDSPLFSELVEERDGRLLHESDLEVIVFGRHYAGGKQAGPHARLLVYDPGEEIIQEDKPSRNKFYVLISGKLDVFIKGKSDKVNTTIEPSAPIFGAMSLLSGRPSNATVKVSPEAKAEVLEIGRPALRLLRKFRTFNLEFDRNHHKHGLWRTMVYLEEVIGKPFSDALHAKLEEAAQFKVYADGHLLFKEGDPIEDLIFIRRGWIQRARSLDPNAPLTPSWASNPALASTLSEENHNAGLDFLGEGNWLGLEILSRETWNYTSTIMARTEVLEIDISDLSANRELVNMIKTEFPKFSLVDDTPPERPPDIKTAQAAAIEIHEGIVDGANLLVMDMNLCVRCGNCSMACHRIHGQSRLMRHGIHIARPVKPKDKSIQSVLAPSVCLHCHDAECLTGCPTGAIRRFADGQIDIEAKTCIGCGDCATHCPYDAISMIERKSLNSPGPGPLGNLKDWISVFPQPEPPAVTDPKDLLAVKCNLCSDRQTLNPKGAQTQAYSCEENCPTGALVRVNPHEYFSEAGNAVGISFRDSTHAIGRNIHKDDPTADRFHRIGWRLIIAVTSAVLWGAYRYNLDGHLFGTWLTMRWITGALGLFTLLGVISYPIRKQIYKRRAGPLRYWKLAHVYLGVLAGIVFLIHGGRDSGGLLTSLLMVSFDLTIVAGLFGIGCYYIVPRIMTDIEEEPLLIEDLKARRKELRETLGLIDTKDDRLRYLIKKKMRRHFFSLAYLLRQYVKREKLSEMLGEAWKEFQADGEALGNADLCESLKKSVRTTATLRRVDALIYLHQLLKLWLAPHVVSASLMLGLMVVHIIQVILFTVR